VSGEPIVEVTGLVRRFGSTTALAGVDLTVGRGQIFAVVGHNGAGKTTLLRLLNGLLRPTAGTVRVWGHDPYRAGSITRARTGAVTESTTLDEFLSVRETLHAYGRLFDVPRDALPDRVEELVDLFELGPYADRPARELSAGMRQRAAFARGLVHRPELLLLDEPTANLDPVAAHRVRAVVADLARRIEVARDTEVAAACLAPFGSVHRDGPVGELVVLHDHRDEVPRMVAELVRVDIPVVGVATLGPTLEDVYLDLHRETVTS
jgi:ABC-type multidrug transport system ATPase subunit